MVGQRKQGMVNLQGVQGARVAGWRQQAVPQQELLLLTHCDQQVDSSFTGLGGRVPVQCLLQR